MQQQCLLVPLPPLQQQHGERRQQQQERGTYVCGGHWIRQLTSITGTPYEGGQCHQPLAAQQQGMQRWMGGAKLLLWAPRRMR